ncbi:hypothetical protein N7495_007564 [Penicillium taxi]|uniref:uncharacterized protein n=1 Tax=Penicillium taxi TaxID=168475 RepID=UPI002545687D|nr:uncharacterized protein N7495_007564 [Penicillium taxi]KAJ5887523.1 hypothetical protein N7495_007564 [Penicillium taxi]
MLLKQGANINAQSGVYGSALRAACAKRHDKVAQMLLERGADVNDQNRFYENALQAAYRRGYHNTVQILQEQQCADQSTFYPPPYHAEIKSSKSLALDYFSLLEVV